MIRPAIAGLLFASLIGGCRLVDQTTFNPEAGRAPVVAARVAAPAPEQPPDGPPPLLTVRFGDPAPYDQALRDAVAAARARKRDVTFDVVAVAQAEGSPAEQAARAEEGAGGAARVAEAIVAQGVAPGRVRLQTRTEPRAREREVRVYVR